MKTEEHILIEHTDVNLDNINLPELSKEELLDIEKMVEFTRHFLEINQLYRVFQVNLNKILYHYTLNTNDTIEKMTECNDGVEDIIIINALVINYISSAKTFTEAIENFNIDKLGEYTNVLFKDTCLSKIYDKTFSYRLLIRLRDYSQHGHLPVYESWDKKYSFDLDQILNTPHFRHNSKLEKEMNEIKEKIVEQYMDNPRIMFTRTIAEFQLCIMEIYKSFIELITPEMKRIVGIIDELVKKRPEIIYNSKDMFNGYILYEIKDKSIHCINPNDKPMETLEKIKSDLEKHYEKEKKIFQDCFKEK